MKVFVIMGNDYPDRVFEDETEADKYCEDRMDAQKAAANPPRIYWRAYEFNLIEKQPEEVSWNAIKEAVACKD